MRILMLAAEADPFAKEGGLGDAVTGLATSLAEAGARVSVFLPLYWEVLRRGYDPVDTGHVVRLRHGGGDLSARIGHLRHKGADFYFVGEEDYFLRDGIYGTGGNAYPDSAQRFSFFTRAALSASEALGLAPDVVHCHDWHTATTPFYLPPPRRGGGRPAVLLTIHNIAYQGIFEPHLLPQLGLPFESFHLEGLEFYGKVNFLKGGIAAADALTAVSPTYAREILTEEGGCGLEGLLRKRKDRLTGIPNGIDTAVWDPAADPALPRAYGPGDLAGKAANKQALQKELGLAEDPSVPLFAFIGRMVEQKGVDLLAEALPAMVFAGGQLAVLGSGSPSLERMIHTAAEPYPGKAVVRFAFDSSLARRIYAGCDFYLMPSRYEPCGLGQLIGMRYGVLPVARRTGGLADSVTDLEKDPGQGNGFLFSRFSPKDMIHACERAVAFYHGGNRQEAVARVMRIDHSWRKPAGRYMDLYREMVAAAKTAGGGK